MKWFDKRYIAVGHKPCESVTDELGDGRWLVDTVKDGTSMAQPEGADME